MEKLTSLFCALVAVAFTAHAETLLLRGATVHTVAKGTLTPGDVLVRDGKDRGRRGANRSNCGPHRGSRGLHLFPA
jgi:hypothetical protein